MKQQVTALVMIFSLMLASCGGRDANPVQVQQYGDHEKSCGALEKELKFINSKLEELIPDSKKAGKNAALGVAGYFLLVPWFFMDFGDAEDKEIAAFQQRYVNLSTIAEDKNCKIDVELITEKDLEEMKKEEKAKNPRKPGESSVLNKRR